MCPTYEREVSVPLAEIEDHLLRAVERRQYGVLGSFDLREKMKAKGVEFDRFCRVFEVCNPSRAKRVLETTMSVSTALPCRISVYEEGGKTMVATMLPTTIMAGFAGGADLEREACEVEEDLKAILDELATVA